MNAMTLPQYLIESSICLICFYFFYSWILKRETIFQFNRFYLLFTALFSLTIPFLNFEFAVGVSQGGFNSLVLPVINEAQSSHQTIITAVEEPTPFVLSIGDIIRVIYFLGVFIMLLKFLDALFKVLQLIKTGYRKKQGRETLVNTQSHVPASSFFSFIFWSGEEKNSDISDTIMDHELVHVRQWHSLDVILMEVMVILKWFNPLIYLFRNSLRLTHEYIADRYVSGQMDKLTYANILLTHNATIPPNGLRHTFYSDIRQRLRMLGSGRSNRWTCVKLFGIVPILISLMTLFSFDFTEKLNLVNEGMEIINDSYEKLESTAVLSIEQSNEKAIGTEGEKANNLTDSDWRISYEHFSDLDQTEDRFIFRWGNLLEYLPKIDNDRDYELTKHSFLSRINTKPTVYTQNQYWKKFEFDLLLYLDNIHIYTERVFVNDSYDISRDEFAHLDFDKLVIENLVIEDSSYAPNFMFTRNLSVTSDFGSNSPRRFTTRQVFINGEEFSLLPFHVTSVYPIQTEITIDELIDKVLREKWEVQDEEQEQKPLNFDNYDVFIDVYRDMVIDDSYVMKDGSLPSIIEQQINNGSMMDRTITESLKNFDKNSSYHKSVISDWFKTLSNNDRVYISINDKDGNSNNGEFICFVIQENNLPYEPDLSLGKKYAGAKLPSNYQIIYRKNKRSLVKVDIEDPKNDKIVKAFSDTTKYEILHIPNFKTDYRIVEYKDALTLAEKTMIRSLPVLDELDIYSLPEFKIEKDMESLFLWGRMMSMPDVGNFSLKEFHRSRKTQPYLKIDNEKYNVVRFTIYIAEKGKEPKAFQSSSVKAYTLNNYLDLIDNEVAVYFDDIIIEKEGEWYHVMDRYSFVFE